MIMKSLGGGMRSSLAISIVALAFGLMGCTNAPAPVNYGPSSTLTASGALKVEDFKYLPSLDATKKIKPNQIRNTAIGNVLIDKNIDVLIRDAVFTELRFVGVKVGTGSVVLTGEVNEFMADDLGYSIDWTLDVHYVVKDAAGRVTYDSQKVTKNNTDKFNNVFVALNQQIKQNIESLIQDPAFISAIN